MLHSPFTVVQNVKVDVDVDVDVIVDVEAKKPIQHARGKRAGIWLEGQGPGGGGASG